MGVFNEIAEELKLTEKQLKDKDIQNFALQYGIRKQSNKWLQYWNGNGICELNKEDGTMITTVLSNEDFNPEFPLNCDMNISNCCKMGCAFCYQGCTPKGKHADIKKYIEDENSFLWSLHEGTELALNGNEPLHPDLELLLKFCKERGIFANLTVNEKTLVTYCNTVKIEKWLEEGLIHGIGVSPSLWTVTMLEFAQKHPTTVIHTIAGITTQKQYECLMDKGIKILILGYKDFGRGVTYHESNDTGIRDNINWLQKAVKDFPNHFKVVSFDNLAIKQLEPEKWLTKKQWETFYRGDDGHHTMFIDLVDETFAKNSVQPKENHKSLMKDIRDMLKDIKEQ